MTSMQRLHRMLVKIGAKVLQHARHVMIHVAVPRPLFDQILVGID